MLSSKSVTAPVLNLQASRILAGYTILGHGIALSVLFYPMEVSLSARLLIAVVVIVSFIYHWQTREPVQVLCTPRKDKLWLLQLKDGREVEGRLYGEYTVTGWFIVLRFLIVNGNKLTVVLLPDSGDKEEVRRLRVYLKQLSLQD